MSTRNPSKKPHWNRSRLHVSFHCYTFAKIVTNCRESVLGNQQRTKDEEMKVDEERRGVKERDQQYRREQHKGDRGDQHTVGGEEKMRSRERRRDQHRGEEIKGDERIGEERSERP